MAAFNGHGFSPAQEQMAAEMDPKHLGQVLDEELRPASLAQPDVRELALGIIDDSDNLSLTMGQWGQVQSMIETGIRAGRATAR